MWVSRRRWNRLEEKVDNMKRAILILEGFVNDRSDYNSYVQGQVPGLMTRVTMLEEALKLNLPTHVPAHWELNKKKKDD